MRPRLAPALAVLLALIGGAVILIAVELGDGAASAVTPAIKDPCEKRAPFPGHGLDATIQRIVLDGLDGAACRLGTSREQLVVSLRPTGATHPRWTHHRIDVAVRAGMLRAVDEAKRRGDIPGFVAGLLRRVVEVAPIDALVRGAFGLGDLLR